MLGRQMPVSGFWLETRHQRGNANFFTSSQSLLILLLWRPSTFFPGNPRTWMMPRRAKHSTPHLLRNDRRPNHSGSASGLVTMIAGTAYSHLNRSRSLRLHLFQRPWDFRPSPLSPAPVSSTLVSCEAATIQTVAAASASYAPTTT
jgi:hypothetical protein